ncbi:MAG: carboxypeptidase regulatory-like domain-containing protein [bacterium]
MQTTRKQFIAILTFLGLIFLTSQYTQVLANGHGKIIGKVKLATTKGHTIDKPELKVSAKGGIQNVVITIEGVQGDFREDPIEIDQKNKAYVPRISVSMVGNELTFVNSDAILHNVHGYEGTETLYNFAMPKFLKIKKVKLDRPGLMKVRCDVHQQMVAYVLVAESPYYATTNQAGLFQIEAIPPRTYTIRAWHETLGSLEQKVTVVAGEKKAVIFEFPENEK